MKDMLARRAAGAFLIFIGIVAVVSTLQGPWYWRLTEIAIVSVVLSWLCDRVLAAL